MTHPQQQQRVLPYRVRSLYSEDSPSTVESEWKEDEGIRATNCDFADCDIRVDVIFDENKIPVEYTCGEFLEEVTSQGPLTETTLSVDYEALIPLQADPAANDRYLQWRILLAAVKDVGLDRCDFNTQRINYTRRNQRQLQALDSSTTLYAIRSDLSVSSALDIPCEYLAPDETTQCISVRTVMVLKYQGDPTSSWIVVRYVQDLLEKTMLESPQDLLVKDVVGLRYVGKFQPTQLEGSSLIGPNTTNEGNPSVVRIGTLVSAASAVVLILFLFLFRRRPKDMEDETTLEAASDGAMGKAQDLEAQSPPEQSNRVPISPKTTDMIVAHLTTIGSSEGDTTLEPSPTSSGPTDDEYADDERERTILMDNGILPISSSDSDERPPPSISGSSSLDMLPPRPPRRSGGESVQLKAARRRRKKKKRRALQRSLSRENVTTMEAIPESDGSEFDESTGSEYSTDEDASSNHSSSTNSTPNRAGVLSLPGSRTNSPSPRGNNNTFFPSPTANNNESSTGQDVKFFIDALDFGFGEQPNNESIARRNSASPRRRPPPSPKSPPRSPPYVFADQSMDSMMDEDQKGRPRTGPWI